MEILYSDDEIIVCLKPAGVLCETTGEGKGGMVDLLLRETGAPVYPVHRLDRDTAGVMVFARTAGSAAALSAAVSSHEDFRKEYLTVVEGKMEESRGEMQDMLYHDSTKNKSFVVSRDRRGVRRARLAFESLAEEDGLSLVRVFLYTGRTHQIRVQFSHRGHPVTGDRRYGSHTAMDPMALFSFRLTFAHPVSGKTMTFSALPEEVGVWAKFSEKLQQVK